MTKSRKEIADWSTINTQELKKLPRAKIVSGAHIDNSMGSGCAGDPPGFPSYFLRHVYNQEGNEPRAGSSCVIVHPEAGAFEIEGVKWPAHIKSWDEFSKERDALFMRLWNKLPIDHPRVVAWIRATFAHHKHCYQVPELRAQGKNWSDAMLIWPGGTLGNTPWGKLRNPKFEVEYAQAHNDFDKWTDAHKAAFLKEIEQSNAHIKVRGDVTAIPDNHSGTIIVRRYYPEFNPTQELIAAKFERPGNWWEVMSARPSPENCPGQYDMVHPCNGSWCQMCGWHEPVREEAAA